MFKRTMALVGLTLSLSSNAALVDNDWYTTDTSTQTDYLDLSLTAGHSYDDVITNDVLGYISDGWVLTSQSKLANLIQEDDDYDIDFDNPDSLKFIAGNRSRLVVTNMDLFSGQNVASGVLRVDYWVGLTPVAYYVNQFDKLTTDDSAGLTVSLMRDTSPVPVPAAAWLFGSALIGLAGIKRKKL